MQKKFTALILFLSAAAGPLYSAENPFPIPPSALSAAHSEGSFSSMLNPVFSDMPAADGLAYRYVSYDANSNGNHFASLNLFGFDLVFSGYNTIPDDNGDSIIDSSVELYSINRGFFFGNVFGIGAGYSFSSGEEKYFNDYSGWNAGFLFRPVSFLSFGLVFKDFHSTLGGDKIGRNDIYSISLRPWKEYLTFSADCVIKENSGFNDAEFYYSAELKGYKDISFILKYGTDKSFTAGLTLPFFIRSGNGAELTLDAYGSNGAETADFKSAGIAVKFKRKKGPMQFAASENYITLRISDNYTSERDESGFFSKREATFQDLVMGLEKACCDPTISGFIIEIDSAGFGMAQIQEIRDLLNRFRSGGKKVYAVLNYSGNKEYYLASASDKIFFTPNSTFSLTGLSAKVYFIKGLLDKGGVKFESVSKGKYKSFSEAFTRKEMSKEARENLTEIISELNEQFITAITADRKLTRPAVEELFSKGFYTPEEAREKGFIDEIMYRDEAVDSLQKKVTSISFADYIDDDEPITYWGAVPAVAVINVTGSIVSGKGGGSAMSDSTGDYSYSDSINAAFSNPDVKAVIIRIDSGGGSAAASDFMWNALYSAKKKNPKPVVFSFGNTAASGGYYIACTGDPIFADKATITGSIGVVAGKVSAEELYSKLGISTETIKMSEFADIFSESRSLTQREKDLFQRDIDFIYSRFTAKVMEGRKISGNEIAGIAEGKIHTGAAAKNNKLINETGGIIAAIEYARTKGEIDTSFRIINLPENGSVMKGIFSGSEAFSVFKQMKFVIQNIENYRMLDEGTLYIQPYSIEIE